MYYLDANGKRVYTLKVCSFSLNGILGACGELVRLVVGVAGDERCCHGYGTSLHRILCARAGSGGRKSLSRIRRRPRTQLQLASPWLNR